ncbi:MAG: ATP-binding cassette domain-containing protein, partial [Chloroflexota bacterium]|nr:ATP-binding cassette domain-containing protein [Chloroflexota bacterium]
KSAILSLIPRFYDVSAGRVLVDGHDVREVTLDSLRAQIGIVLQETFLFSITIRENIAFGRPDASLDEVIAAATAAQAHTFISAMPAGYETKMGERGVTLSGGQKQRLAIARALLLDPRILLLDDATSSVDTETEHVIQQALRTLMAGRTSFIIAQRLTTVRQADQILVVDEGRIVDRGTHLELLSRPGPYRELYDLQLRDQDEALQAMTDRRAGERQVSA